MRNIDEINDLGIKVVTKRQNGEQTEQTLTAVQADFYECPVCGSSAVEYDVKELDPDGIFIYRTHGCKDCDTEWEERYDMVQVVITPKGEQ